MYAVNRPIRNYTGWRAAAVPVNPSLSFRLLHRNAKTEGAL
jgi:hypothetical protein